MQLPGLSLLIFFSDFFPSVHFDSVYFIQTGFAGYVWAWITLKSRSILLAILSHNLSNFFGTLAMMLK